jgi:hypothetical protein
LVIVMLDSGEALLVNKQVSGFTNEEGLFLIPSARETFPFLLEDGLASWGARVETGPIYLAQVSHDGNLITGRNRWSVWEVAETMFTQLGYTPRALPTTMEERAEASLLTYEELAYQGAKAQVSMLSLMQGSSFSHMLMAMHAVVAVMHRDLMKAFDLTRLEIIADGEANPWR